MNKPKITIIGKRWFDKQSGNTYHTTEVLVDGKSIGKSYFQYGYGNQYIQTGFEILREKGYTDSPEIIDFLKTMRNESLRFELLVSDVKDREAIGMSTYSRKNKHKEVTIP